METKKSIIEKAKTFEDACQETGMPEKLELNPLIPEKIRRSITLNYQLTVIAAALNEGWEPDYADFNQPKYEVYGDAASGSVASRAYVKSYCGASGAYAFFGFRLCFKTRELAEYSVKQFENLYLEYLLGRTVK